MEMSQYTSYLQTSRLQTDMSAQAAAQDEV